MAACLECKFFWVEGAELVNDGECRRNTPFAGTRGEAIWPTVKTDHWRGQFERRSSDEFETA